MGLSELEVRNDTGEEREVLSGNLPVVAFTSTNVLMADVDNMSLDESNLGFLVNYLRDVSERHLLGNVLLIESSRKIHGDVSYHMVFDRYFSGWRQTYRYGILPLTRYALADGYLSKIDTTRGALTLRLLSRDCKSIVRPLLVVLVDCKVRTGGIRLYMEHWKIARSII